MPRPFLSRRLRTSLWITCGGLITALILACGQLRPTDIAADEVVTATVPAAHPQSNGERVLVLRTGGVLQGQLKRIATGWLVSSGAGHVVIPADQVQFDADSLKDAWLRMRLQIQEPRVADHLQIADWCLSHHLLEEATRELRDALAQDSSNETARLMLRRVESQIRQQQARADAQTTTASEPRASSPLESRVTVLIGETETDAESDDARSLAGLSPETAQQFVSSIQPLLQNKCSNARCHGTATTTGFELTPLRAGGGRYRIASEKNLAAVLKQVSTDDPDRSPLLVATRGAHAGRPVFSGKFASEQIATLRAWIDTASRELDPAAYASHRARQKSILAESPLNPPELPLAESTADPDLLPDGTAPTHSFATSSQPERYLIPADPFERLNQSDQRPGTNDPQTKNAITQPDRSELIPRPGLPLAAGSTSAGSRSVEAAVVPATGTADTDSPSHLTSFQQVLQQARDQISVKDPFDPEVFNRQYAGDPSR